MVKLNDNVTLEQVQQAVNYGTYSEKTCTVSGQWHSGLFCPWSDKYGYSDRFPLYATIQFNSTKYHMYYLKSQDNWVYAILTSKQTPTNISLPPAN